MAEPAEVALAEVVARLRRAMRRAARNADPHTTLSVAQLELLSCLAENPGARPGRLAQLLKLAPNSVTTMVNGLQAKELVTRANSGSGDRRAVVLELTEAGRAAVHRWQATNAGIVEAAVANLHPAWQHLLTAALPALRELVGSIDDLAESKPSGSAAG
ncbi:MarR family transcriptional regulator [Amycolatopsis mongoliensis]|uniref:MarR family transcriptional regulator n=1 Tax=Amycolatopsis mongoliensis TaxID=715475 RepID=A0A9Y2JGF2_9PSEU|nr:MarR family transcriptional regulator [Amycolatopsis sp. 4-36]WIX98024.1 MarR family transcriptional regulator [Amycolatopsis sp. 4-36]